MFFLPNTLYQIMTYCIVCMSANTDIYRIYSNCNSIIYMSVCSFKIFYYFLMSLFYS